MHKRGARLGFVVLMGAAVAACSVGPRYQPDRIKLPPNWAEHRATAEEIARTQKDMQHWWDQFQDPLLSDLVRSAIAHNYDLREAGQKILKAQALRDEAASAWYPQLDGMLKGGHTRSSTALSNWPTHPWDNGTPVLSYGATASWQLDVFGQIKNQVQAGDDLVGASMEQRRAVLMTLLSQLVGHYVDLRVAQLQLDIADRNIKAARATLALTEKEYQKGTGTSLQVAQARADLQHEEGLRAALKTRISQSIHALEALAGEMPGSWQKRLLVRQGLPAIPRLPVTLPSLVLASRPDIRAAERQYAAATARIGVAVSNLYPSFNLPLSYAPMSATMRNLFSSHAMVWSVTMANSLPLAHGGGLSASVREAQAQAESARLHYRQTVLNAMKEVENGLASWRNTIDQLSALEQSVHAGRLASARAISLYKAGLSDFINVLQAQRALFALENARAQTLLARYNDAISLYTALGAGWQGVDLTRVNLPVSTLSQNMMARAWMQ